jgi:Tfp pilus assembly protein PilX
MKITRKQKGSVMLIAMFIIALMTTLVIGIIQMNTEEIQLTQNQVYAAEAICVAEAGLNDAFAEIRNDDSWTTGFTAKAFSGGSYDVTVTASLPNVTIGSTGTSAKGFVARIEAEVTVGTASPYVIRIDDLKVNE